MLKNFSSKILNYHILRAAHLKYLLLCIDAMASFSLRFGTTVIDWTEHQISNQCQYRGHKQCLVKVQKNTQRTPNHRQISPLIKLPICVWLRWFFASQSTNHQLLHALCIKLRRKLTSWRQERHRRRISLKLLLRKKDAGRRQLFFCLILTSHYHLNNKI